MDNPQVYLLKLTQFSRALRLEGLPIALRETEDAARLLVQLGFAQREQVKTALRTVYAKSQEEQAVFDRVFDTFFVSEEVMRQRAQEQAQRDRELEQARLAAQEDLQLNGQSMDLSARDRETYAAMPEEERQKLRSFMDRYKESAARNPELYTNFIHSVFARTLLEQQMKMEDAGVGCEGMDPELGMLYRDISQFSDTEIPKAIHILQGISQQINSELSAKRSHSGRSSKLDFRRTIRKGLETGGSFYRLQHKRKRQRRRHLVILCDVSGSMVQFSEFALRLIQQLNHVSESSRVFLFSEKLLEADVFSLQNMDLFRDFVRQSGAYGKGTDLGTALTSLRTMRPAVLSDATTLLILSDTKTIDQPRAIAALQECKRLAGRLLWLNPIPENKWQYIRSIQAMASVCPMVACDTLSALASACKRLARI